MDIKKNKEEFQTLLRSTKRSGVEDMLEELEKMGFYEAPASSGNHLNTEGGLVEHSLNTCKAAMVIWEGLKKIDPSVEREVEQDSVIIASLLHDICKSDIYVRSVKRRKTRLGTWEESEGYKLTYKNFPLGHGEKSLVLALCGGIDLTDAEMMAIRWHMGAWGINHNSQEELGNYKAAKTLYSLVNIIHTADTLAAGILERKGESIDEL